MFTGKRGLELTEVGPVGDDEPLLPVLQACGRRTQPATGRRVSSGAGQGRAGPPRRTSTPAPRGLRPGHVPTRSSHALSPSPRPRLCFLHRPSHSVGLAVLSACPRPPSGPHLPGRLAGGLSRCHCLPPPSHPRNHILLADVVALWSPVSAGPQGPLGALSNSMCQDSSQDCPSLHLLVPAVPSVVKAPL